jgi:hypothetical protein
VKSPVNDSYGSRNAIKYALVARSVVPAPSVQALNIVTCNGFPVDSFLTAKLMYKNIAPNHQRQERCVAIECETPLP